MSQTRSIWGKALRSFLSSIRPRQFRGNLMGGDHLGNKYFEIPADPRGGKRNATRWFDPSEKEKFDQEIPSEWEAWLRGRRKDVPSTDEVLKNVAISLMKKENSKKVAVLNPFIKDDADEIPEAPQFPVYSDYVDPDKKQDDRRFKPL